MSRVMNRQKLWILTLFSTTLMGVCPHVQADQTITPCTNCTQVTENNTLQLRKQAEGVVKTQWLVGVNLDDSAFKNVKLSAEDYFAAAFGAGSGYFDVNKRMDATDSVLCSGVVAANMMHWWLTQNQEHIAKYQAQAPGQNGVIKEYYTESRINRTPNKKTSNDVNVKDLNVFYQEKNSRDGITNQDQSEFFDIIREAFTNNPLWTHNLLNMYINGYIYTKESQKEGLRPMKNPTPFNFFHKVFKDKALTEVTWDVHKDNFSRIVKDALDSNKALAVSYGAIKYAGMGHIVSVWGADFDEHNQVKAIYITDSDDRTVRVDGQQIGMKRYKVSYDHSHNVKLSAYKESGSETTGGTVRELTSLSLGTQQWQEYFAQQNQ
ncbi:IdeS/Mac family cysteine endopeptidase [Streptococcus castoreus]|uniref:IdeS/Mac family cysteine endopeptidase n=1 Tax=Streptococcus castoreus TaxID=254786 RepID=UPI0003FABB64|nr:IdeS/Mac family cysteine endopeptidase [Streptococcus castoreus]